MNRYDQLVSDLKGVPSPLRSTRPITVLSEAELSALEAEIGYTLPVDYREFLRDYGGYGFFSVICEVFRTKPNNLSVGRMRVFGVEFFYSILPRTSLDLLDWYLSYKEEFVPPGVLPIVFAGGSNTYCLTLAGEQRGTVSLYIMDDDMLHPIAPSFDDFLHKLVVMED